MSEALNTTTIERLAKRLKEPSWLTELRRSALREYGALPWPSPSDEIWRRTDVSLLDPMQGFALPEDLGLLRSARLSERQIQRLLHPIGSEHLAVRADGAWVNQHVPPDVIVADLAQAAQQQADLIKSILEKDGLTPQEQKLTSLNGAFHHDDLFLQTPEGFVAQEPLRVVRFFTSKPRQALFPLTVVAIGKGSSVVLIDEYVGLASAAASEPTVINGRIELVLEAGAQVHYVRIQRWDSSAREFLLQRATLHEGAQLTLVSINIGAQISKTHIVSKLIGPLANSKLYGFVFGHGQQHVDQHTLQDHQAPHTFSDLLFKAALKDSSRMIYTGLIRIAKQAKQTDAYQANHNLLLSQSAKAETIPMLEIMADDVSCKHGATVGPVDEEQVFYLMTRGVLRELAERLIVMGFVEPIIQQIPYEVLQERLREELEGGLRS